MDGPVATRLTIFAGAIDRIDDPHPLFGQAFGIVLLLFRQQSVFAALLAKCVTQELVGGLISRLAQCLALKHRRLAHRNQQAARHRCQMSGKLTVG